MLFIKYVSDKYGDPKMFKPAVKIPEGAGFRDKVALKGKLDIGDKINNQIIQPLIDQNDAGRVVGVKVIRIFFRFQRLQINVTT